MWDKAAALLHGLASTQGFQDGNKRTAWLATSVYLGLSNKPLRPVHDSIAEAFVLAVSVGVLSHEQIVEWLRDGVSTDFPKDESEEAGWMRPGPINLVAQIDVMAGGISFTGDAGMFRTPMAMVNVWAKAVDPANPNPENEPSVVKYPFAIAEADIEKTIEGFRAAQAKLAAGGGMARAPGARPRAKPPSQSGVRPKKPRKK